MAMFKALLRMGVAAGAKAAAEPTRREAIASFMLSKVNPKRVSFYPSSQMQMYLRRREGVL